MGMISGSAAAVILGLLVAASGARAQGRSEPEDNGWALELSNDALGIVSGDQNFSAGIGLSLMGSRARDYWISLDPLLGVVNGLIGVSVSGGQRWHTAQYGAAMFTPGDLQLREPIRDDHPYGCLPFLANTRMDVRPAGNVAFQSTLLLGLLGTELCEQIQRGAHELTNDTIPRGWENQISEGGEPTARYSVSRLQPLLGGTAGSNGDLVWNLEAAAGTTTHLGTGVSGRWGRIATPWWSHTPGHAEYLALGPSAGPAAGRELYLFSGAMVRARAYNVLLQGQFRDSEVTFDRDDLNPVVAEGWLGIIASMTARSRIGLILRARSPELRSAQQEVPVWGSLVFSFGP